MKTLVIFIVAAALCATKGRARPPGGDFSAAHLDKDSQVQERDAAIQVETDDVRRSENYQPTKAAKRKSSLLSLDTLKFWNWPMVQGFRHWIAGTRTEEKLPLDYKVVKYPKKHVAELSKL